MKLNRHFKSSFSKTILIGVVACSFLTFRFGKVHAPKSTAKRVVNQLPQVSVSKPAPLPELPNVQPVTTPPVASATNVQEKPNKESAPKKHFTVQKHSLKWKQLKAKEAALNNLIEEELASFDAATDALDIHGPVEDLIASGFIENSQTEDSLFASNGEKRPVLANVLEEARETFATEGTFTRESFDEIKSTLASIKQEDLEINQAAPDEEKNVLVVSKTITKPLVAKEITNVPSKVKLQAEKDTNQSSPSSVESNTVSEPKEPNDDDDDDDEPILAAPVKRIPSLSPMQASMAPELTGSQFVAPTKRVVTPKTTAVTNQHTMSSQSSIPNDSDDSDVPPQTNKLNGTLYVDDELDHWLTSNKGHIELSLHRFGSRNPEDTIKLFDYTYPEREFEHDTSGLEGKYQLAANIYSNSDKTPYLQILYPKMLSAENFGEKAAFYLKMQASKTPQREVPVLNVTVFEAANGNYRQAKPVESADIHIVGLESLGNFRTDKEGNARIENIPTQSELLLEVSASGYYPTRKIVPVTSTSAYATVSLIEKQKVDTITGFFTKKPQDDRKALIMGRVFNTENRRPLADDQISLSNRKGHALYFNALPDTNLTSSTSTGLFAFMNVEPAFRAIFRSKSQHALPIQPLPGYGYFADLGRGGKKSIKAVVTDPVQNQTVWGSATTIGSNRNPSESDEKGRFEIKDVDLPTGNVTIEFRAKDYPVTWYTLPWDTREATRTQKLYILEKELVYESAMSFARVRPEKHKGIVVGGADAKFFEAKNKCVKVELLNNKGQALEVEKGPYLLYEKSNPKDSPCLTKNKPGFAFYNIEAGEYILNWKNQTGTYLSSQIVRVGADRLSIVVR